MWDKNLQIMANAENALLELSSILEFGDKGMKPNQMEIH
jgi:hypothetical protein